MPVCVGLIIFSCLFLSVPPITSGLKLYRAEFKTACQLHLIILNWRNIGIKFCTLHEILYKARVRQVVFTDVLIVGRLDVDGQSFAPIGFHKTDAASDWLPIKSHCIGTKGFPGVQLRN